MDYLQESTGEWQTSKGDYYGLEINLVDLVDNGQKLVPTFGSSSLTMHRTSSCQLGDHIKQLSKIAEWQTGAVSSLDRAVSGSFVLVCFVAVVCFLFAGEGEGVVEKMGRGSGLLLWVVLLPRQYMDNSASVSALVTYPHTQKCESSLVHFAPVMSMSIHDSIASGKGQAYAYVSEALDKI